VLVGVERSGLIEARHQVTVAAVDAAGNTIATLGEELDRPFFFRSAIKPFQASVSQRLGAGMVPEQLAVASSSHGGQPVHVAYVRAMLGEVGLDEQDLACPPAWPTSPSAARLAAFSDPDAPRRVYNNCSGKHAAMLRACVASGWPLDYTDPDHPLQKEMTAFLREMVGSDPGPVGVDGCGVPTFRGTIVGLATALAKLGSDPGLAEVASAAYRFAPLTSDGDREEARISRWVPGVVKGGAEGCLGFARFDGIGVAAKAWSGALPAAAIAVVEMLRRLGLLPAYPERALAEVARPVVLGGGRPVGVIRPLGENE
jgi:L-asparaginase II